jgi:hypothetical protein
MRYHAAMNVDDLKAQIFLLLLIHLGKTDKEWNQTLSEFLDFQHGLSDEHNDAVIDLARDLALARPKSFGIDRFDVGPAIDCTVHQDDRAHCRNAHIAIVDEIHSGALAIRIVVSRVRRTNQ